MKTHHIHRAIVATAILIIAAKSLLAATNATLLGWNNLGMHCMDSDYSVFSILPPYNTIEAQLIVNGVLVTNGSGYTVTYEAVSDPTGSINKSSIGKGNWSSYESIIYGAPVGFTADQGLVGWNMPGPFNTPQAMLFEASNSPADGVSTKVNWFHAEGIPLMPYDDAGIKNTYPMMRLVARDSKNNIVATNNIVLPVSDEMDCSACHGASTHAAAMPTKGWITDQNKIREYRLNILALHDDREFFKHPSLYTEALAAKGYDNNGLLVSATGGKPVLCAACHASEALGAPSFSSVLGNGTVPALTSSVHSLHASVTDPKLNLILDSSSNRSACYLCHPGSTTRCLRGAMGSAVASDGTMAMQCQSCHGSMTHVGSTNRVGWFMEPKCQSCHSGTASVNSGQIRYTSVYDAGGNERVPADTTFATTPNTPASGISLYRFSIGHGGLQCSACHGSTHAEFPSSHPNDNIRNIQLQGHVGAMAECTACHASVPSNTNGGPHGLHPIGQSWVNSHGDAAKSNTAACQTCHGTDYRGTVLSRALGDRTLQIGDSGTSVKFFRGATIGCYTCHNGPANDDMNRTAAPGISNVTIQTRPGVPVVITLPVVLTKGVAVRIVSQPVNGTVGLSNNIATYFPYSGFEGSDTFTFAAYNGAKNSALGIGNILVKTNPSPTPTPTPRPSPTPVATPTPTPTVSPIPKLKSQTIRFIPVSPVIYHTGATITLSATASSGLPVTYNLVSGPATLSGPTLILTGAGTIRITVSQGGNSFYKAAASVTKSIVVRFPPYAEVDP